MSLFTLSLHAYALNTGSGRRGHRDDPGRNDAKLSDGVRFSQPTGLASSQGSLFIADSDSSSIRRLNFLDKTISTQFGGDHVFPDNVYQVKAYTI
jgi:hypothetical protein